MITERIGATHRLSDAVVTDERVHLAGQIAEATLDGDAAAQTAEVLGFIDEFLTAAGSDRTKILTATIWLADIGDFAAMNAVWDAWVPAGHAPARATVEARLADPRHKVEIMIVAAR